MTIPILSKEEKRSTEAVFSPPPSGRWSKPCGLLPMVSSPPQISQQLSATVWYAGRVATVPTNHPMPIFPCQVAGHKNCIEPLRWKTAYWQDLEVRVRCGYFCSHCRRSAYKVIVASWVVCRRRRWWLAIGNISVCFVYIEGIFTCLIGDFSLRGFPFACSSDMTFCSHHV